MNTRTSTTINLPAHAGSFVGQPANDNGSRHADLNKYTPCLAWFYAALSHSDEPLGTGEDYESDPPCVIDIDPKPMPAEELIRAHEAGALRIAGEAKQRMQFVTIEGADEPRLYSVPSNAITHVWGSRVTQEVGRFKPSRAKAAVAARKAEVLRYCVMFGAIAPSRPKKLFKRRKMHPPIDWTRFAHIRARTLEGAREAAGLPPADFCMLRGFPSAPAPSILFANMQAGRGPRAVGDESESRTYRPDPDNYAGDATIVDRIFLDQFRAAKPDAFATLESAATAGSMSDLVASNDNKTGKRRYQRAAEELMLFLAA